jgi:hypothetical protein
MQKRNQRGKPNSNRQGDTTAPAGTSKPQQPSADVMPNGINARDGWQRGVGGVSR